MRSAFTVLISRSAITAYQIHGGHMTATGDRRTEGGPAFAIVGAETESWLSADG